MRKFTFLIICLPVLIFALAAEANAQACGWYYIKLKIQDVAGDPIKNAAVNLAPIEKDEMRGQKFIRDDADASLFLIKYPEGYSFSSFHSLTVSADGFKPTENKVVFGSCQDRDVIVKLARSDSVSSAVWQFKTNVNIRVLGEIKQELRDVKLTIIDREKQTDTIEMKFGLAYFYIRNGEYNFRFEKPGYQTKDVQVDLTALAGKNLEVELKPQEK